MGQRETSHSIQYQVHTKPRNAAMLDMKYDHQTRKEKGSLPILGSDPQGHGSAIAVRSPLHRNPSATRGRGGREWLSIRDRNKVVSQAATRTDLTKNATVRTGGSTGLLACCHDISFKQRFPQYTEPSDNPNLADSDILDGYLDASSGADFAGLSVVCQKPTGTGTLGGLFSSCSL